MYPSQDNIGNSTHVSNITGFINNNCNRLPQTTAATIQAENINCNNPSCNCNNDDTSVVNNKNFPTHATISLDHNQPISDTSVVKNNNSPTHAPISFDHNQPIFHSTSNNNDINSLGNTNYQQPIFNDGSNNGHINISPNNKYQQSMSNNASTTPQFYPQYIDQDSPQTNVFPSLNSLGIVINSPQTYVVIMPSRQQDTYPNHSITDSLQTQFNNKLKNM